MAEVVITDEMVKAAAQAAYGSHYERHMKMMRKALAAAVTAGEQEWQPGPPPDNVGYVDVREVTTYRFMPYKPDGRRQMGKRGRWQSATQYGFENCDPPVGEWRTNPGGDQ